MLTEKQLIDLSFKYRVTVTRLAGDVRRYKFFGGDKRHTIHFMGHGGWLYYGAYGVPGFNHPTNGRYIPPVFYADGAYGILCSSADEPMVACTAGRPEWKPLPVLVENPSSRLKHVKTVMYKKQQGYCFFCRRRIQPKNATCDHLIPMSRGGLDEESNWVMSCYRCNAAKKDMLPDEFIALLKRA